MCAYQTLFHANTTGYVIRCTDCKKIQLGYGNLMLTFNQEDFTSFHRWVRKIKEESHDAEKKTLRSVVIPTSCEGVKLLLSLQELRELDKMMEGADTELQAIEMIKLFNER